MGFIQTDLPVLDPYAIVTRHGPDHCSPQQTIILSCRASGTLNCLPVLGSHRQEGDFGTGAPLAVLDEQGEVHEPKDAPNAVAFDACTNSVYFNNGGSLLRLSCSNVVSPVAGLPDVRGFLDGPGDIARFSRITAIAPDGNGGLVVADDERLRRLQTRAAASRLGAVGGFEGLSKRPRTIESPSNVQVTTLYARPDGLTWTGLAYDAATGALIATTRTAVYRLLIPSSARSAAVDGATSSGSGGAGNPAHAQLPPPLLVAGSEGINGCMDGAYTGAEFNNIDVSPVVDGRGGTAWLVDDNRLCRVDLGTGSVTTVLTEMDEVTSMTVLPNGYLATCNYQRDTVRILALHLTAPLPPPPAATAQLRTEACTSGVGSAVAAATSASPPSVHSSGCTRHPLTRMYDRLQSLGDQDPTADVTLRVLPAGARFRAHKAVLAASSEYFDALFFGSGATGGGNGGFAEISNAAGEVDLPEADPAAFAVLLRYCYCYCPMTPGADPLPCVPPSLLRSVAELADRLLMPAPVVEEAQRRLLAATWPTTVVDDLLWAEERGPRFEGLRKGLRAFQVRYAKEVMEQRPDLMVEMYEEVVKAAHRASAAGGS